MIKIALEFMTNLILLPHVLFVEDCLYHIATRSCL